MLFGLGLISSPIFCWRWAMELFTCQIFASKAEAAKHGSVLRVCPYPTFCRGGGRAAGDGCCDGGSGGGCCSSGVLVEAVCFPTAHNTATHAEKCTQETLAAGRTARPGRRNRRRREEDKAAVSEKNSGSSCWEVLQEPREKHNK